MNLKQHFFKHQAFSLVELLASMFLFSFLITGVLALYSSQINTGQSIAFKSKLESIHDKFQYLLSKEEHCTNFIGDKTEGGGGSLLHLDLMLRLDLMRFMTILTS